jgi:hypothetical protein
MNEADAKSELSRLEAEHPNLMALLRSTPAPPEADTGKASAEELLAARALAILGSAGARESTLGSADGVTLSGRELQTLLGVVADRRESPSVEISWLRAEIDHLRESTLSEDAVRVLVAKVFGAAVVSLAAIAAIVVAIVKIA